jgi:hypothetical protein
LGLNKTGGDWALMVLPPEEKKRVFEGVERREPYSCLTALFPFFINLCRFKSFP